MRIIDLHCDTVGEMFDRGLDFSSAALDISQSDLTQFDEYIQVTAIWSRKDLSNEECWDRFIDAAEYLQSLNKPSCLKTLLAVEDARLVCGDLDRLALMREMGVRFLTLMWAGETQIGGAHDSTEGLTAFGERVVRRCFELGIVPDVSHASDRSFDEIFDISREYGKPIVATHSNSRSVYEHARNLTDDMYLAVASTGGITGVSLEPTHLGSCPGPADAARHLLHYFDLSEDHVCLGCDFDGRTALTTGLEHCESLIELGRLLVDLGLIEEDVDRIFYRNAHRFMKENNII